MNDNHNAGIKGQNYSKHRKPLWLGPEMKQFKAESIHNFQSFREEAETGPQQPGREMDGSGVGSCWRKESEVGGTRKGETSVALSSKSCTPIMGTLPHPCVLHPREVYWETTWARRRARKDILTSEVISISGERMEKSGTRDASLNTGWHQEVTWHDDKEQDVSVIHKVKNNNFQDLKCNIELYCTWCDPSDFQ